MAALSDVSFGLAPEVTPGTYVAPTRWYEVVDPSFDVNKSVKQGKGARVGSRVNRSARRVVTSADATGQTTVELSSKGMGLLWESSLGVGTSTLVGGTTFQQNFTGVTGTTKPSRTLQTAAIRDVGTVDAQSFLGAVTGDWELDMSNDDIFTLMTQWDCMNWSTAQSYVAPSYATAPNLFHFSQVAYTLGGTVTGPTATTLASGGTASTAIRSLKVKAGSNLVKNRYNGGGAGRKSRQLVGDLTLTGELEIEYIDTVIRDAFLNDTPLALTATVTTAEALSVGFATFQVYLGEIKLNGEMPKSKDNEFAVLKVPFDALDNLTAAPITVIHRTADSAL